MNDLELTNVSKRYGNVEAVVDLSLAVARGEFLTLLGPSGCGKTTTLSMVAGFVAPDRGEIRLGGRVVNHLPPYRRDTATVFQQYALFPHMTVFENIAFGLRMRKVKDEEIKRRVERALEVVRLPEVGSRRPIQLSGGQQQRVAFARAVVTEPTVLLLDEPLSNLDLKLREQMRVELRHLHLQLGITTIYVTHDQGEALVISDRIAVMNQGVIEQLGTPVEIYEQPRSAFVAMFIGSSNLLECTVSGAAGAYCEVKLRDGQRLRARAAGPFSGRALVAIRPEHLTIGEPTPERNVLHGTLREVIYLGSLLRSVVELPSGQQITVEEMNQPGTVRGSAGNAVSLTVPPDQCLVLASTRSGADGRQDATT